MRGITVHRVLLLVMGLAWGIPDLARGADAAGNYSVRGVGANTCEGVLATVEQHEAFIPILLAWLEGYLTGHNRLKDATFDALFITDSGRLGSLVLSVCRQSPEIRLETAAAQLLESLRDTRVREQSQTTRVHHDGRDIVLHRETVLRAQRRLAEAGMYTAEIDGAYGPAMSRALRQFQREAGLALTGVPDSDTLIRLFLSNQE